MKFVWPVLLGLFRTLYLLYTCWCRMFVWLLLAGGVALACGITGTYPALKPWLWALFAAAVGLALYAIVQVYRLRAEQDPNPWQSGFMAWFGTLKLFENMQGGAAVKLDWPSSFLVENPRGYRITGPDLRAILAVIEPGDILLRGYEGYVDGAFIRRSSRSASRIFQSGWYTHAALYAGPLTESDRALISAPFRDDPAYFSCGPQQVIHAMAKGVHTEDLLTFLRCDYLCILRLPPALTPAAVAPPPPVLDAQASLSDRLTQALRQTLASGQAVPRKRVTDAARCSALQQIGQAYDFDCSDTQRFHRFSCAELVYYCLRGVSEAIGLSPQAHAFYPLAPRFPQLKLLERITLTPDDLRDLANQGTLQCIWEDACSQDVLNGVGAA